jgi:hypothetical protein
MPRSRTDAKAIGSSMTTAAFTNATIVAGRS